MTTTYVTSILLIFSLVGLSAAAISDDSIVDAIRLRSDDDTGLDELFKATTHGDVETRPWKCCNDIARIFLPSGLPPLYKCRDKVDRCSSACHRCEETDDSRYTCDDSYNGDPGPKCKDDDNRPWKCCNKQVCTTKSPPTCRCLDIIERCDKACKYCEEMKGSQHKRYSCLDAYFGDMAPPCGLQDGMQRADGVVQVHDPCSHQLVENIDINI